MVRRNTVWVIHKIFDDDFESFIRAPEVFVRWNESGHRSDLYDPSIYENIRKFNLCEIARESIRDIFGRDSNRNWIPYESLIEELVQSGKIIKRNHGDLIYKNERHRHANLYTLPTDEIRRIFATKDLVARILDKSSYTLRQQKLLEKIFGVGKNVKCCALQKDNTETMKTSKSLPVFDDVDIPDTEVKRDYHAELMEFLTACVKAYGWDVDLLNKSPLKQILTDADIKTLRGAWDVNGYHDPVNYERRIKAHFIGAYKLLVNFEHDWKPLIPFSDANDREFLKFVARRVVDTYIVLTDEMKKKVDAKYNWRVNVAKYYSEK